MCQAVILDLDSCGCTDVQGMAPKSGSHFGLVSVPIKAASWVWQGKRCFGGGQVGWGTGSGKL